LKREAIGKEEIGYGRAENIMKKIGLMNKGLFAKSFILNI
jgi:hypothetical protein